MILPRTPSSSSLQRRGVSSITLSSYVTVLSWSSADGNDARGFFISWDGRQKYLSDGFSHYNKPEKKEKNSINFALEEIPLK